jgi:hypothetical protein
MRERWRKGTEEMAEERFRLGLSILHFQSMRPVTMRGGMLLLVLAKYMLTEVHILRAEQL